MKYENWPILDTTETGEKPVSVQQVFAVLLAIACVFLTAVAFLSGPDEIGHSGRVVCKLASISCAVLFVLAIVWHFRANSRSRNAYPDVLGGLFRADQLFQSGTMQLACQTFSCDNMVGIRFVFQNIYDDDCEISVRFPCMPIADLSITVCGAGVTKAEYFLPLKLYGCKRVLTPKVKDSRRAGKRIRHNRRRTIKTEVNVWQTVLAAFAGYIYLGGGRTMDLDLTSAIPAVSDNDKEIIEQKKWKFFDLWDPDSTNGPDEVRGLLYVPLSTVAPTVERCTGYRKAGFVWK